MVHSTDERRLGGGAVKLKYLEKRYPAYFWQANILYLVSSALPAQCDRWIKWAKRNGATIVLNQNGVAYHAWAGDRTEAINSSLRQALLSADIVLYQSAFSLESSRRFLGEATGLKHVLHNAVDVARFRPRKHRESIARLRLIALGSHHEVERLTVALRTLQELLQQSVDAELLIAGRLQFRADSEASFKFDRLLNDSRLLGRVRILPPYSQEEAPSLLQSAHILIHPKYKDPCPTVVIEALACGLPVVGSASGGMEELVGDAGLLAPVADSWEIMHYPDPLTMAKAITTVASEYAAFSDRARKRAETLFSLDSWLQFHETVFRQASSNNGTAAFAAPD